MIYLAGPLTAATPAQVDRHRDRAVAAYLELVRRKIPACCPHLSAYIPSAFDLHYDLWMHQCMAMVAASSGIWMLPGWPASKGALLEYNFAANLIDHTRCYFSLGAILRAYRREEANAFDEMFPPDYPVEGRV